MRRALARGGEEDRYERMDMSFHQRLHQGFLDIARHEPRRYAIVPANGTADEVAGRVWETIRVRLLEI